MEDTIIKMISTVGIPAGIALYVLVEINKTIKKLDDSIDRNTRVLISVLNKLEYDKESKPLLSEKE